MKKIILGIFATILNISVWAQTGNYTLVFSDDFEGSSLDLSKWNIYKGYAANQEQQYYTDNSSNLRVENGNLIITAKKEQAVTDRNYTSAKIESKGKGFINRGKAEGRISLPSGAGTWPAFWMMPESNVYGGWPRSGEIDIMEHIGSDPTMISHAVHTCNKNGNLGNNWFYKKDIDGVENNFHTYSIIWENTKIMFYIDDVKSTTLFRNMVQDYKDWPFDQNFYVILNLALGGTMGGTIDDNIFNNPVEMKVDYVRLYQDNTPIGINPIEEDNSIEVYPTQFSTEINIKTENPIKIQL